MRILTVIVLIYFIELFTCLNETCIKNDDCPSSEKTSCIEGVCQCDALSKFSSTQSKCLKYATEFAAICFEKWQCFDFLRNNSECINNRCLCQSGYRWYQGKCQKFLKKGDTCSTDGDICLDETNPQALKCVENVCQCNEGFYDRGPDCRIASSVNYECAITADCFPVPDFAGILQYSYCKLGFCVANSSNSLMYLKTDHSFDFSESHDQTSGQMIINRVEEDGNCPNGVSSNLNKTDCLQCNNTVYFKNFTCICQQGFFLQNGRCIAELGMRDPHVKYNTDKDCPIKPGNATNTNGICYCKNYWFQDFTNRECKKTTLQYTYSCMDNDWCLAMGPNAYCDSETQKCQCNSQSTFNATSFFCEQKENANLTGICQYSTECPLYEQCVDGTCQCNDGFYQVNNSDLCLPKIGSSCEIRDCSHIENAICLASNETCQCADKNYATDGYRCLKIASNLTEECVIEEQCKNLPNSVCKADSSSNGTVSRCLCLDDYVDIKGHCYQNKKFGSNCSTRFNCTVVLGDTFVCRNGICQCPIDATFQDNRCQCVSGTKMIDYRCVSASSRINVHVTLSMSVVIGLLMFLFR